MTSRRFARPVRRGWVSGVVGTAAMTATAAARQRSAGARGASGAPVDYDASHYVVDAAATVLRRTVGWAPSTDRQRRMLFVLVHWGYGSSVACAYPPLTRLSRRRGLATAVFYAGCQTMAFTLFPLFGGTQPPWRWSRRLLASSLAQHAVYVVAVDLTDRLLLGSG